MLNLLKRARPKPPDVDRLCTAIHTARQSLAYYRERRREMVRSYAGRHWSEEGSREPVYLNLLALYTQVVSRSLISKNPRVMISTSDRAKKPVVSAMQDWANRRIEEMYFADVMKRVVYDALFSVGIVKVALAHAGDAMQGGWNVSAGTPFCERVSLDDFVFDVYARDFAEASFVGHRYRLPLDAAEARFGKKAARELPRLDDKHNENGDERLAVLGRGYYGTDDEFEDMVECWEVYLPRRRKVVTLAGDAIGAYAARSSGGGGRGEVLDEVEWVGPPCGPYHFLGFEWVPDNPMPKGPAMDLFDLHLATNQILRKLIRQALRQKSLLGYSTAAGDDADRIQKASDGDILPVSNVDGLKPIDTGGANPGNFTVMQSLKEMFSWKAGNLDIMGGLSPQSKTATQDKMLNENSSRSVADMQDTTVTFTGKVLKSLCWYWHYHPELVMKTTAAAPGYPEVTTPRATTPADRRGQPYDELDIKIDPYSLVHQTPQAKLAAMNSVLQGTVVPLLPVLEKQGVSFDAHAYMEQAGEWLDLPELADVVVYQEPAQPAAPAGPGAAEPPGMPANTNRTYTRENVSGTTQQGTGAALANAMAGTSAGGNPETTAR